VETAVSDDLRGGLLGSCTPTCDPTDSRDSWREESVFDWPRMDLDSGREESGESRGVLRLLDSKSHPRE